MFVFKRPKNKIMPMSKAAFQAELAKDRAALCSNQTALATEIGFRQGMKDGRQAGKSEGLKVGLVSGDGFNKYTN